jgi:GTP-binding protein
LARKPQIVVINKIDLPAVQDKKKEIKKAFREADIDVHFISAVTGEGIAELMQTVNNLLKESEILNQAPEPKVFRPLPRHKQVSISKDGEVFVVSEPELERIVSRVDMTDSTIQGQILGQMVRLHVDKALEKAGIKRGNVIRCGAAEWEW